VAEGQIRIHIFGLLAAPGWNLLICLDFLDHFESWLSAIMTWAMTRSPPERFFDNALFPAGSDITEIRFKKVMAAHGCEAGIHAAFFTFMNVVHGSLHVVVDAVTRNADLAFLGLIALIFLFTMTYA
jgi:hypothetical protein